MIRVLCMVSALALVAGCSKKEENLAIDGNGSGSSGQPSQPTPSTGGGTGNVDGPGDVVEPPAPTELTPAERCFAKCDQDFVDGDVKFSALDDCVQGACMPAPEEDPTTAPDPSACAPIDSKKISYGYGPTDLCAARVCCAQATACANDPSCLGVNKCYDDCAKLY